MNFHLNCINLFEQCYCNLGLYFFLFSFSNINGRRLSWVWLFMFGYLSILVNFGQSQWKMFIAIYSKNITKQLKLNLITVSSMRITPYIYPIPPFFKANFCLRSKFLKANLCCQYLFSGRSQLLRIIFDALQIMLHSKRCYTLFI